MTDPERDLVGWDELDRLVAALAEQVRGEHDTMLAITRGGLVPAGMLAYRLGIRDILVAAVAYYDDGGHRGETPTFLQFPADPVLRGRRILVVDEVWDSGATIAAVVERVRAAGGDPDDRGDPLQAGSFDRRGRRRTISPRRRTAGSSTRSSPGD